METQTQPNDNQVKSANQIHSWFNKLAFIHICIAACSEFQMHFDAKNCGENSKLFESNNILRRISGDQLFALFVVLLIYKQSFTIIYEKYFLALHMNMRIKHNLCFQLKAFFILPKFKIFSTIFQIFSIILDFFLIHNLMTRIRKKSILEIT